MWVMENSPASNGLEWYKDSSDNSSIPIGTDRLRSQTHRSDREPDQGCNETGHKN